MHYVAKGPSTRSNRCRFTYSTLNKKNWFSAKIGSGNVSDWPKLMASTLLIGQCWRERFWLARTGGGDASDWPELEAGTFLIGQNWRKRFWLAKTGKNASDWPELVARTNLIGRCGTAANRERDTPHASSPIMAAACDSTHRCLLGN